ncbi:molecular chaperone DnaJ [Rhizobium sp. Root274]|uniref:molecular chaperone DnaJ n=1 Tax=unclassified Rhizobium TaxID=2613769 RepID=UPI0007144766|nr:MULTISPECIES: molecular chaperone DnaJ [unclassified Rhizobium]KQW30804.1 molecular chaperone DnaJ [Rhizobium sp. Root1240]KRD32351.1 molecular chaperone DnaJ [Rhizobium sp. Root274]
MIPYPLQWPDTMPRWSKPREPGNFRTGLSAAIKNVQGSLKLFASDSGKPLTGAVISSNVTLGVDKPSDPGVAVWFTWDGLTLCIPVDRYSKVEANLQAIHHIVEARRTELRHGTLALVKATFTGFTALPAPGGVVRRTWRQVFMVSANATLDRQEIDLLYREMARDYHPDKPDGSHEKMSELNRARDEALREIDQ